jgi:hypothetical protein
MSARTCLLTIKATLPDSSIVKIMSAGKPVLHPATLFYNKLSNIFIHKLLEEMLK